MSTRYAEIPPGQHVVLVAGEPGRQHRVGCGWLSTRPAGKVPAVLLVYADCPDHAWQGKPPVRERVAS